MDRDAVPRGGDDVTIQDCWKRAREAFGTSFVFEKRSQRLATFLRVLGFMGLVVPVVIGGLVGGFGIGFGALPVAVTIGAAIAVLQAVFSLWSLAATWVESYAYAIESMVENRNLYAKFKELAESPPNSAVELQLRYEILKAEDKARREQDLRRGIKPHETRLGMRAGLRELGQTCVACGVQPYSMESTACSVCGSFDRKSRSKK
ncbi:mobilome CxxCx(11)CxxC protein [Saccharothrix sp. HUAS TT1]|uniref:mobilome CxxCx(11)CxxC protein n=1 Tax=unclassified Saccharothrix TaxID=2593673 RepID=UPI00345B65D1